MLLQNVLPRKSAERRRKKLPVPLPSRRSAKKKSALLNASSAKRSATELWRLHAASNAKRRHSGGRQSARLHKPLKLRALVFFLLVKSLRSDAGLVFIFSLWCRHFPAGLEPCPCRGQVPPWRAQW